MPRGEPAGSWRRDVDLAPWTGLRCPVRAAALTRAPSVTALRRAFAAARERDLPVLLLGGGSNLVLLRDWPGLCVVPGDRGVRMRREGDRLHVRAGAAVPWEALVDATLRAGAWGLENLAGIPGSVGAAPVQNIGAYGAELSDVVRAVHWHDRATDEVRRSASLDCAFGYRTSAFKNRWRGRATVLAVDLELRPGPGRPRLGHRDLAACADARSPAEVAAHVRAVRARKLPDPTVEPNVGSFFVNPVVPEAEARALQHVHPDAPAWPGAEPGSFKLSAAWLIDRAGLKGAEEGGFAVSRRHALVIVNRGAARADGLEGLIHRIRSEVLLRFGIRLVPEPTIWPPLRWGAGGPGPE